MRASANAVAAALAACALLATPAPLAAQKPVRHVVNQYAFTHWFDSRPADARALMLGPGGRGWVGCGDGTVRILEDRDGDGAVSEEEAKVFVSGTWSPNGLAWRPRGRGCEVFVCYTTAEFGGIVMVRWLFLDLV
jgi:hypothetical protein